MLKIILIFTLLISCAMKQAEIITAPKVNTFIPYGMTDKLFTRGVLYLNSMKRTKFYCGCGCGKQVSIFRGEPRKFRQGHATRMPNNKKMHSERMLGNKLFEGRKMPESAKRKISRSQMGKNNSVWNGGRTTNKKGYTSILKRGHPFCDVNKRVKEERLVMEKHLRRFLTKKEIVHHKDNNPSNNNIQNLQVVSGLEHRRIHLTGNSNVLGFKHSKESKLKMSKAKLGHVTTKETRRKISEANKGQVRSEEMRKRMSESRKGLKNSEQTKRNKSNSAKIAWKKRKELC